MSCSADDRAPPGLLPAPARRPLTRRQCLAAAAVLLPVGGRAATPAGEAAGEAEAADRPVHLVAAWRCAARLGLDGQVQGDAAPTDYVGVLVLDWAAGQVRLQRAVPIADRVHGLVPDGAGGFYALAYRPGAWLVHVAADGRVQRQALDSTTRTLNGHAVLTPDRRWLLTTETDPRDSAGWISVRDAATLQVQAQWRSHGEEPHDLRLDEQGGLWVANGGIRRAAGDRKVELDRMDPSLARLNASTGALQGQWRLPDPRLSLRHLAVNRAADGAVHIGVGLQAEHDDPAQRAAAPTFALWDGQGLQLPSRSPAAKGYVGDISAGPAGSFYLASERAHQVLRWWPRAGAELQTVGELERAGALAPWSVDGLDGVFIASARGVARWHPLQAPRMLRWPLPMALDNHWVPLHG